MIVITSNHKSKNTTQEVIELFQSKELECFGYGPTTFNALQIYGPIYKGIKFTNKYSIIHFYSLSILKMSTISYYFVRNWFIIHLLQYAKKKNYNKLKSI